MTHSDNEIQLSVLSAYSSVFDGLQDILGLSKAQIKKQHLAKKWLSKELPAKSLLSIPVDLINRGVINADYDGPPIDIIYEDKNFLVLNKPPSVHCHPLAYNETHNCLSFLRSIDRFDILKINKNSYDRGLLYRLDKVTSGVLFYVKEQELFSKLRRDFSTMVKEKIYLAVVIGNCKDRGEFTIHMRPSLSKGHRMKATHNNDEKGSFGKLSLHPLQYDADKDLTLVQIALHTGLRHQIRLQLSELGHPILGDELYGGTAADRVFLHCYRYVVDMDGSMVEATANEANLFETIFNLDSCL